MSTAAEEWRNIEGFPYQISSSGRVWSEPRIVRSSNGHRYPVAGRYLQHVENSRGYSVVALYRQGGRRSFSIPALMRQAGFGA
jgi:hypothetical protein